MSYSASDFMDDVVNAAVANGCEIPPVVDEDGQMIDDYPMTEVASQKICAWLETVVSLTSEERAAIGHAMGYASSKLSPGVVASVMKKIQP